VLFETGEVEEASRVLGHGLRQRPDDPGFLFLSALIAAEEGARERARSILRDLLKQGVEFPERAEAQALLGTL
jgi:hypothetical protein